MTVNQSQQTTVVVNFDQLQRSVNEKERLFHDATVTPETIRATGLVQEPAPPPETAQAVVELLGLAEVLRTYLRPGSEEDMPEAQRLAVQRWRALFEDEVRAVIAVRNQIAHASTSLSAPELGEALAVGRRLRAFLQEALTNPPMP